MGKIRPEFVSAILREEAAAAILVAAGAQGAFIPIMLIDGVPFAAFALAAIDRMDMAVVAGCAAAVFAAAVSVIRTASHYSFTPFI